MKSIDRFQNTDVYNSITNDKSTVHDDNSAPFSLLEWFERTGSVSNVDNYVDEYNGYLRAWRTIKNTDKEQAATTIKDVYIAFLKEIVMKYTSSEEKRYIQNVDFSNPVEAEAAVPFFAKRIREIIQIIHRNRHQTKFQKIKYSLKGSALGLEKAIFDNIMSFLLGEQLESLQFDLPDAETTIKNMRITFDELYDIDQSYFDNQFLYSPGLEFLTEQGNVYVGYYNVSKQSDGTLSYLTGKELSRESEILTRIDARIPLKSNISAVRYGATRTVDLNTTDRSY